MEIDLVTQKPVLHISMMYPAKQGCLALVMPLCAHPSNSNGVIVYDLRESPDDWLSLAKKKQKVSTPGSNPKKLPRQVRG